jgi:8-oxo-dGTP pyrophosphatase MutT (NUDIX family)
MSSSPGSSGAPAPEPARVAGPALEAIRSQANVLGTPGTAEIAAAVSAGGAAGRAPPATGSAPRDAATVVLLRPATGGGYAVYLVKRAQAVAFMGGAHVFPGGRVDPRTDASPEAAACREALEEARVRLDPAALVPFARWVTPEVEPKRFDARFFLAAVPEGEAGGVDRHEVTEGVWLSPADALAAADRGEIALPPPTLWNLQDLAALPTIERALEEGRRRAAAGIEPVCPRLHARAAESGRIVLLLPGDPEYESPAGAAPSPDRQRRFELIDGRWACRRPPAGSAASP